MENNELVFKGENSQALTIACWLLKSSVKHTITY